MLDELSDRIVELMDPKVIAKAKKDFYIPVEQRYNPSVYSTRQAYINHMTAAAGTAGAALNCSTTIRVQIALCQCPAGTGGILGQLNEKIGNLQEQLSGISMPVLAPTIVPTTGQTALNSSMNLTGIRWDLVGLGIVVVVAVISPVEGPLGDYAAIAAFSAAW